MIRIEGEHGGRRVFLPVAVLRADNPMDITHKTYTGLLDTGATSSWISPRVVADLELFEIAKERVSFAMDEQVASIFLFRLGLFPASGQANELPFVFAETRGFQLRQRDDFDVILGMDVLSVTDFRMDRNFNWSLSFG